MSEQAAPLPLFILAVAFLLVWNMDPVSEEQNEPSYVETQYHVSPINEDLTSNPDAVNSKASGEEEEVQPNTTTAE